MNFDKLIDAIRADYVARGHDKVLKREWTVVLGRKYAKIVPTENGKTMGVWGFVQLADDKKFKAGDILMAAGWQGPARNFPRGNIVTEDFGGVTWCGTR